MRDRPDRTWIRTRRTTSSLALLVLAVFVIFSLTPNASAAPNFPLVVYGYVYQSDGTTPVEGALVIITIQESGATRSVISGYDGAYDNADDLFLTSEYEIGDTVQVEASTGSDGGYNTGTVSIDGGPVVLDVVFSFAIPEFGNTFGVLAAMIAISFVGIAFAGSKRK